MERQATEDRSEKAPRLAGFWIRLAAAAIDATLICGIVWLVIRVLARAGSYLPLELTIITSGLIYSVLLIGWRGQTLGKALCGVRVRSRAKVPLGFARAIVREAVGKPASAAGLFLGYVWIAFSRRKRGWHDLLAGSLVFHEEGKARRHRITMSAGLLLAAVVVVAHGWEIVQAFRLVHSVPVSSITAAYLGRAPTDLVPVSRIGAVEKARMAEWIGQHGQSPLEYAVARASAHQVIIFGESHERAQELEFLNEVIPALYHQAGVRCVALEVCLAEDNAVLDELVRAPEFDRSLAMEIARHQPWGLWGWKGYWDVLETAWRLNQSVANDAEKLRIIGLDRPMDMPSMAMVGFEDNPARDCPVWEKLRILRVLRHLPRILARDAFMAAQIEKEILNKRQRGIVWVGRNHSIVGCPQSGPMGDWSRMGFLLRQRNGDKVFQIRLHGMDLPVTLVDPSYKGPAPMMADVLEVVMLIRDNKPVGFDVAPSPLAMLRDEGSFEYRLDPRLAFADVAEGFVFLAPRKALQTCRWLEGYISPPMFVRNRPFYQAFGRRAGVEINTAEDANAFFARLAE